MYHDLLSQGHPGIFRTMANIQRYFWWLEMYAFVKSYIQWYTLCQQIKVNTHPLAPSFTPIKTDSHTYLFLTVTIDFITDLSESNGYNVLYVVVDYDLIKAIILILCTKTIDAIGIASVTT